MMKLYTQAPTLPLPNAQTWVNSEVKDVALPEVVIFFTACASIVITTMIIKAISR